MDDGTDGWKDSQKMDDGTDGWKASRKRTTTCSRNWHPYCLARRLSFVRAYTCVCYSRNGDEVDCPSGFRGGFIVSTILPLLYVILYLQGRLHCRYHSSFIICNFVSSGEASLSVPLFLYYM
jgi:hypothetical protein